MNIEEKLKESGVYVGKTEGDSMNPLIVEGRDKVIIKPPVFPLKKYAVPLYKKDGHYTLHRIIKVTKKGYIIRGDNRYSNEYDVSEDKIVGVLSGIITGDKVTEVNDKVYLRKSRHIVNTYPLRKTKRFILAVIKKIKKTF